MKKVCKLCGKEIIKNPHESYKQHNNRVTCSTECQAKDKMGKPFSGKTYFTHLQTSTRFYNIWTCIKTRCLNNKNPNFKRYGGKGINICKRWMKFENFYEDMRKDYDSHKNKYGSRNTTIDRMENSKGYYKENCRWATYKVQSNNREIVKLKK